MIQAELQLNVSQRLNWSPGVSLHGQHCENIAQLCRLSRNTISLSANTIHTMMYTLPLCCWLAVFLGYSTTRLIYEQVWDFGSPVKFMLSTWKHSLRFDCIRGSRVQHKVFMF